MPVKRFPTPFALNPIPLKKRATLEAQGFVKVWVKEDGFEIMIDITRASVVSVDTVYLCDIDRTGLQVTVHMQGNQGKQVLHWDDDGDLMYLMLMDSEDGTADSVIEIEEDSLPEFAVRYNPKVPIGEG